VLVGGPGFDGPGFGDLAGPSKTWRGRQKSKRAWLGALGTFSILGFTFFAQGFSTCFLWSWCGLRKTRISSAHASISIAGEARSTAQGSAAVGDRRGGGELEHSRAGPSHAAMLGGRGRGPTWAGVRRLGTPTSELQRGGSAARAERRVNACKAPPSRLQQHQTAPQHGARQPATPRR